MRFFYKIVLLLAFLAPMLLQSCSSFHREGKCLQRTLLKEQTEAMEQTQLLAAYLEHGNNLDSVRILTHADQNTLFYIFDARRMVYWSNNWLASDEVLLLSYDRWWYRRFHNAHAIGRWTRAGQYNILTVIPVKYAFPVENRQLRNTFCAPFKAHASHDISKFRQEGDVPIYSDNGDYLFALTPHLLIETKKTESAALESFSYRSLLPETEDAATLRARRARTHFYLLMCSVLMTALILWGIIVFIRHRGFRNMRLSTRFTYVVMMGVTGAFLCFFVLSIRYVIDHHEQHQRQELASKTNFVQTYLQSLYYWDMALTADNTSGMNIDLHDLSFSAKTDIHVYDNQGILIATSTPGLFANGLLSARIAPEPFFSDSALRIQEEKIGQIPYLCAYTPFYNGSFVQIGYIAVPSFISQADRFEEVDHFLSKLLLPYFLVLIIALFIAVLATRSMTYPLVHIAERMQDFRIGGDNHIIYLGRDEVAQLVERYNSLVDQVEETTSRLAKAEREGAWRTMARQIAHEINNPLTPMKLTVQQLQRLHGTDRFDAYFEAASTMLVEEIDNLSRIAASFSTFAKQPEVVASEVDVAQRLSSILTLHRNNPEHIPIRYVGPDQGVIVWADSEQIPQVFTNLLRNAVQAMIGQKDADIIVILNAAWSDDMVEIRVSDNGPGIPDEISDRVFMPNFTTKSTGMGLGLAISKNIIEGTGGKICFQTSKKGTTFFVYLKKKQ